MSRYRAPVFFLTVIWLLAFSISVAPTAFAQTPSAATTTAPRIYEAARETTVGGTISEVVTRPKAGLPLGLHLMVETAQGQMDVQLGPYFGRLAAQKGLLPGATIQVTGETFHFNAGDVFLARTITVGNQTITVRNQYGFPVRPVPPGARTVRGTQRTGGQ
jgi:hypothetical protein